MIYVILSRILLPFLLGYLKLRKRTFWHFKQSIQGSKNRLAISLHDRYFLNYGSYVGIDAVFVGEPCFPHGPSGVFISSMSKIGKNVVIFQHVTIGSNSLEDGLNQGSPMIGDNVYIGAGAKIIGNITIGDNCRIGANAVVYKNLSAHTVAIQSPTRLIQKNNLDNRFISYRSGVKVYFDNGKWLAFVPGNSSK